MTLLVVSTRISAWILGNDISTLGMLVLVVVIRRLPINPVGKREKQGPRGATVGPRRDRGHL